MSARQTSTTEGSEWQGTQEAKPVPMPEQPLTRTSGITPQKCLGSMTSPSSSRYSRTSSSSLGKMARAMFETLLKMYRAAAWVPGGSRRLPNWPRGSRSATLFVPTCSCASPTIDSTRDVSPCR